MLWYMYYSRLGNKYKCISVLLACLVKFRGPNICLSSRANASKY
uniref:Uncharacterized protein n=1 Tax=Rhizophora mucronata TaxID=61149 RepID=A0A2P2NJX5_RHIMU